MDEPNVRKLQLDCNLGLNSVAVELPLIVASVRTLPNRRLFCPCVLHSPCQQRSALRHHSHLVAEFS
jgi:hypothetical protein